MSDIVDFPSAENDLQLQNIPDELKKVPHWFVWRWQQRAGKTTKPPYMPNGKAGKANDPKTWSSYVDCTDALSSGKFSGIGFVLTEDLQLVAWDLDHCIDPKSGELAQWAENIVESLKSYTEITPSGEGLRIFSKGNIPKSGTKKGPIECYKDKRYLTVTGNTFRYNKIIPADNEKIFESVFNKKEQTEVDKGFELLSEGKWKEAGYPSQSEADLAFCCHLAKQTNADAKKMDALFRKSKLFRPKWDVVHHADGTTYGQSTIAKAIKTFKSSFGLTDLGNAKRFVQVAGNKVKYCGGMWYIWDGMRFKMDTVGKITYTAEEVVNSIRNQAATIQDDDLKKRFNKYADTCESAGKIGSMIQLAATRKELVVEANDLDPNPFDINLKNGTLCEDIKLVEHDPNRCITKLIDVEFDQNAECPIWDKFLNEVLPDEEVRGFLQRCVGYTLTGSVEEQKLFFVYGIGANGKSTFIETIQSLLKEYATTVQPQLLMATTSTQLDSSHTMLADLRGVRLAIASETEDGRRLNESLIKNITGDGSIKARYLYRDWFEYRSTAKLWIVGNHKPVIRGIDKGIWRRIVLIPFLQTIPEGQQDRNLQRKFLSEMPGILNWCVKGLLDWRESGLRPPTSVIDATEDYKVEQDVIQIFLDEQMEFSATAKVLHSTLYERYVKTMEEKREYVMSNRRFSQALKEKGYESFRGTGNKMYWGGMQFSVAQKDEL